MIRPSRFISDGTFALLAFKEEPNIIVLSETLDLDVDKAGALHHEADTVERLKLVPGQRQGVDASGVFGP